MDYNLLNQICVGVGIIITNALIYIKSGKTNKKTLEDVKKEVLPNSGASMRDAIHRIEENVGIINSNVLNFQNLYNLPLFRTDRYGLTNWINNAYSKLVGVSYSDVEGLGWLSFISPKDRGQVKNEWDLCLKDKRVFDMEYTVVNKVSQKEHVIRCVAYPILIKDKIVGFVGTLTEI